MIVVVPHGSTPTGVGLAVHEVEMASGEFKWHAQPLSPCCGDFMDNHGGISPHDKSISAFCAACGYDWTEQMFKGGSTLYISFDLEYVRESGKRWLSGLFGVPEDELQVTVE